MGLDLDLRDLELAEIGAWPGALKAACLAAVASVTLAAGYALFLADKGAELATAERRELNLQAEYRRKRLRADELASHQARRDAAATAFAAMLRRLPADTEVPNLIDDITRAAVANDLAIDHIDLAEERPVDFYLELPIAVAVSGGYHKLGGFAGAIAALPRIVTLHDFEVTPGRGPSHLAMAVTAKTYRYPEGAPAPPGHDAEPR